MRGAVEACPGRHDAVGRHAAEPAVLIVIGRTCLTRDVPARDAGVVGTGVFGVFYIIVEQAVHDRRGFRGICLLGNAVAVIEDDVVLGICDVVVGVGLVIKTLVAHVGVGCRHFTDRNTACQTAQRECADVMRVRLVEVLEVQLGERLFIGDGGAADQLHDLNRGGIGGALDRVGEKDLAQIGAVGVLRTGDIGSRRGVKLIFLQRFVVDLGGEVELLGVDRDGVAEQRLDGRTRLQSGVCRSVPCEVGGLAV